MKLRILTESCVRAGKQADSDRDYDECGDVFVVEGTPEEMLQQATLWERNARPGGGGQYDRRVAKTIREAVYDERPDLEPTAHQIGEDIGGGCLYIGDGLAVTTAGEIVTTPTMSTDPSRRIPLPILDRRPADGCTDAAAWEAWAAHARAAIVHVCDRFPA
jgi:hypothetical protein